MNIQHEVVADSGLVYNHAYSLLEARAVENKKGRQNLYIIIIFNKFIKNSKSLEILTIFFREF